MNHLTIILFTKFSTGFTPSNRHITKRERNPYLQHLIMCYTAKVTVEKYIRWFNRSVHFPYVCCIPTNSIKVSTTT